MMKELILRDYYDLLNLHKALMEAKFHCNPENKDIAGSPIIANIMNELVNVLAQIDPNSTTIDWQNWRRICDKKGSCYWANAIVNAAKNPLWKTYTGEKKAEVAKCYISPFTASDGDIMDFVKEVDKMTKM